MTIREHNAPLKDKMEKSGCRFVHKGRLAYFVDKNDKYAPFPVGYITGPSSFERGYYMSVQGPNGWRQRDGLNISELEKWALETAQKMLAES